MNGRLIALVIICLVAGIGVGYAISLPQVSELRSEISSLRTNCNDLNETYSELVTNYTLLIDSMDIRFIKMPSASMEPTLKIGDTVVVRRVDDACEIRAGYKGSPEPGDIIVFHEWTTHEGELIIHRAVEKTFRNGSYYFRTQGDAARGHNSDPWEVEESDIVGKVVAIISQSP